MKYLFTILFLLCCISLFAQTKNTNILDTAVVDSGPLETPMINVQHTSVQSIDSQYLKEMRKHSVDSPIINATGEHSSSIRISTDTLENGKVIYTTEPVYDEFYKTNTDSNLINYNAPLDDTTTIYGTVLDEKGEPILFAVVELLKGSKIINGKATDTNGYFSLKAPIEDNISIAVKYVGYKTKHIDIKKNSLASHGDALRIKLAPGKAFICGDHTPSDVPMFNIKHSGTNKTFNSEDLGQAAY